MARSGGKLGIWAWLDGRAAALASPPDSASVARFAALTSPALAAAMLGPAATGIDAEAAEASRLLNRLRRVTGVRWARHAAAAGIEVACIKGLATAHSLYDDPDLRAMADADLLVRAADYHRLVQVFAAAGLVPGKARTRSRWGFVSDASARPMGQKDGASTIDIHIHPDAWPLHRALSTELLFARAVRQATSEGTIIVPAPTDSLLLAASHAARDLFGPGTTKTVVDAIMLLRGDAARIDWDLFAATARVGLVLHPAIAFLAAVVRLGGLDDAVPAALCTPPRGSEFARMLDDYVALFPHRAGPWQRLRRELLLAAEPAVALRRNLRRLAGLARPRRELQLPA